MVNRLQPSTRHADRKKTALLLLASASFAIPQLFGAFRINHDFFQHTIDEVLALPPTTRRLASTEKATFNDRNIFPPIPRKHINETFGACLMLKEDNDLLYEWLAYHYTTLPLRHVFVASDIGNLQDPEEVLKRWKTANTDLEYWVQNASDFVHRHGHEYGTANSIKDVHHAFVNRQRAFITTCTLFLKSKGLQWVTYIDSDEFLIMNYLRPKEQSDTAKSNAEKMEIRKCLPDTQSNDTILETIRGIETMHNLSHCQTLPRVLVGALENFTCPGAPSRERIESRGIPFDWMSSLRFHQHSEKGDFAMSKYGKVMMKVSEFSEDTLERVPSSIHRPYKEKCSRAFTLFPDALFYLNHYIGSWERYNSRKDGRRNRQEWEKRAYMTAGTSCEDEVFKWFHRFEHLVGVERAAYLLGSNQTTSGSQ